MGRLYAWHITSDKSAYLEGPEPHMLAAVLNAEYGRMEEGQTGWRVMSAEYPSLNYLETDIDDMEQMIKSVNIRLGQELEKRIEQLKEDKDNLIQMMFRGEEEDPYVW